MSGYLFLLIPCSTTFCFVPIGFIQSTHGRMTFENSTIVQTASVLIVTACKAFFQSGRRSLPSVLYSLDSQ